MMKYSQDYPSLLSLIKFVSVLTEEESSGFVKRETERHSGLKTEIIRSFEDPNFSWTEIFKHDEIRDFFDFESEEEACEFATEMFLKPAVRGHV